MPACINCLKRGHKVTKCTSSKCKICGSSHNSLLHKYSASANSYTGRSSTLHGTVNYSSSDERDILETAIVSVERSFGKLIPARAFLYSGSRANLITEELAQLLRLKREGGRLNFTGISGTNSSSSKVNST